MRYNSHKIYPFKVYNSVSFSKICESVELYATITSPNVGTFPSSPQRTRAYLQSLCCHLQTYSTNNLFLTSMDLPFLHMAYNWDHIVCGHLHLTSFTMLLRIIHGVACIILPNNILWYGFTTFYISSHDLIVHLDCFHFLGIIAYVCKQF